MTSTTTDNYRRPFAAIATKVVQADADLGPVIVKTCGHADANCPAIQDSSRILPTATVAEHLEHNEFFDGEVRYLDPFLCRVCHS